MWSTMLQMTDYSVTRDIACQHPKWTNVMMNISRVPREETLHRKEGTKTGVKQVMWRPEQKKVSWTTDLDGKLKKEREWVMSLCAGT